MRIGLVSVLRPGGGVSSTYINRSTNKRSDTDWIALRTSDFGSLTVLERFEVESVADPPDSDDAVSRGAKHTTDPRHVRVDRSAPVL